MAQTMPDALFGPDFDVAAHLHGVFIIVIMVIDFLVWREWNGIELNKGDIPGA